MSNRKKIGIIGLGNISLHYFKGITESPYFELTCVCDKNPKAKGVSTYSDFPYFSDHKKMILDCVPEYVVITVDAISHYEIAKYLLERNINVIIEKPATLNLSNIKNLIKISQERGLFLDVIFHWQHGSEIDFLKNHINQLGKIKKIYSTVFDPYTNRDNQISADKTNLLGTWLDSGVNILSTMAQFTNLKDAKLLHKNHVYDEKQQQPCQSEVIFLTSDEIELNAHIDWNTTTNFKKSTFLTTLGIIDVYHTQQTVYFNGEQIFKDETLPRLIRHYYNYFSKFSAMNNLEKIFDIHKLLFEANNEENTKIHI